MPPKPAAEWLLRNHSAESILFMHRTILTLVGVLLSTFLLLYNLYQLQICQHQQYETRSNDNCIKLLPILPARGLIYDRYGILLADNRTYYQLLLYPDRVADIPSVLQRLRPLVDLTEAEVIQFEKNRSQGNRLSPLSLKQGLTEQQMARFAVNQHHFPGLELNRYQRRYYPYGAALTHVLGYLGKVDEKDKQWLKATGHPGNDPLHPDIGKLGVERYYESLLRGKLGYEALEINRRGQLVRRLYEVPPQAGSNLTLTLDVNLQCYIEKLMQGQRGAVVALDPNDGAILALLSTPSYDPNLFAEGIAHQAYQRLLKDPDCPLVNRATQGIYPPASTVKPFISIAALEEGVVTRDSSRFDPGWWQLPGSTKRYWNCKRQQHGEINLLRSLEASSDTFFYQVAYDLGIDRLALWMRRFGYGEYSGIDLAEEQTGLMPTREWKMQRYQQPWYQGDTIPVGIGQGYWTATPIQMVKALTTLLNNGQIKTPHLLQVGVSEQARYATHTPIQLHNPAFWQLAKEGMYGVAHRPHGTAKRAFAGAPYQAGVKSGTAQLFSLKDERYQPDKLSKRLHDHAQLIAFAPYQQPEIALAIIMENAGSGASQAAPLVRKIFDYVLVRPSSKPKFHSLTAQHKNP
jgi:penicillin-binding protein 2